ncbi:MAG: hypothetical protein COA64_06980 [Henriciella sp.]|nr:MAG: hypothetical protein COA64_06980 [Henriciella sp.]
MGKAPGRPGLLSHVGADVAGLSVLSGSVLVQPLAADGIETLTALAFQLCRREAFQLTENLSILKES